MKKWELAYYLIEAKKNIDTIMFISQNKEALSNISIKENVKKCLSDFYVKCGIVLDNYIKVSMENKKNICKKNKLIEEVYYERDKNSAHKDSNYVKSNYDSLDMLIVDLKNKLDSIRIECRFFLPDVLTLDYLPYDKQLYRLMSGITVEKESEINLFKYGNQVNTHTGKSFPIFDDVEDHKLLSESERLAMAVVFKDGINPLEGLQERQDSAIKINLLKNLNMWPRINHKMFNIYIELQKNGFVDKYGVPIFQGMSDPILKARLDSLMLYSKIIE